MKTLEQAKTAHPDCFIMILDRWVDDSHPDHEDCFGEERPAIYVWETEEDSIDDPGVNCVAIYWLKEKD